ncbi:MAG: neutral amino acid transport system permease protein [Thermoplasmata archaeon]|nr:neutral amino acid transport system permease protein [Thermoplasmata archaeon]
MDASQILQPLANGVVFGAILALCAIGLTLIYGILNLSSFAHGDTLAFGAYMAFFFGTSLYRGAQIVPLALGAAALLLIAVGADRLWTRRLVRLERWTLLGFAAALALDAAYVRLMQGGAWAGTTDRVLVLAALLAIAATVALTVLFEFVLWRPLRRKGATVLSLVIASLGLSLVIRNGLQMYFGGDQVSLERGVDESATYLGVHVSSAQWLTLLLAAVVILGVHLFMTRARTGKAMRALADNRDLARVCGIDVDRVIVYVWVLAAALVALAGVLLCLNSNNSLRVDMGFNVLIPIFAAVLLGGIGSPYGAMLGGLVVGVAMRAGPGLMFVLLSRTGGPGWLMRDLGNTAYDLAWAFVVLVLVLLFRPQGILGRKA